MFLNFKKYIMIFLFTINVFNVYSMKRLSDKKVELNLNVGSFDNKEAFNFFKNIIRSLSLTISHFLYMDEELREYARCDIYGIFFDTLRSSYEEIASRALAGETKDIKDLSKQLLSAVYRDCDAFVRDFSSSDNLILNKMIRKVENIALDIRAREEDVLEKIESVLLDFEKKSIFFTMKRVLEIARKPAMVISGGVTTLAGLAIKFEGSYYAPMILPYSGGIFIVVTVTPSVFRWVSSLF